MTFQDGSPYTYLGLSCDAINIGWLGDHIPFVSHAPFILKDTIPNIIDYLKTREVTHITRGFHICQLCPPYDGEYGNGEIWIQDTLTNKTFASPQMIIHYLESHNYIPPEEYINAISQHIRNISGTHNMMLHGRE